MNQASEKYFSVCWENQIYRCKMSGNLQFLHKIHDGLQVRDK